MPFGWTSMLAPFFVFVSTLLCGFLSSPHLKLGLHVSSLGKLKKLSHPENDFTHFMWWKIICIGSEILQDELSSGKITDENVCGTLAMEHLFVVRFLWFWFHTIRLTVNFVFDGVLLLWSPNGIIVLMTHMLKLTEIVVCTYTCYVCIWHTWNMLPIPLEKL